MNQHRRQNAGFHMVNKPWGHEEIWAHTDHYVGKIMHIADGKRLALQYHREKEKTIRVLFGVLTLVVGPVGIINPAEYATFDLLAGQQFHIPPCTIHRIEARNGSVSVIEVSTAHMNDVVRIEDDYERV